MRFSRRHIGAGERDMVNGGEHILSLIHISLVVIQGEKLVGSFSERDYAREVVLKGRSSKTTQISEVMTDKVLSVKPADTVEQAMSIMSDKRIRHLPVVENDKVIGMLSIGDLVKETIDYQQRLIKQLESYIRS